MSPEDPNARSPLVRGLVRGWTPCVLVLLFTAVAFVSGSVPAAIASRPVATAAPTPRAVPVPDRSRVPDLWMPVAGPLVRGFDARAGPFGPGHRGIDIDAPAGEVVRAPAAGRVVFAGPVAGTTWVSLLIAPGVLVTLGPVLDPTVSAGRVRARSPVGWVGPGHGARSAGHDPSPDGPDRVGPGGPMGGSDPIGPGGTPGSAGGGATGRTVGGATGRAVGGAMGRVLGGVTGEATLHLSLRVDGTYVDPLAYLVDRPRARLATLLSPDGLPAPAAATAG
jgi:hypothetical protein